MKILVVRANPNSPQPAAGDHLLDGAKLAGLLPEAAFTFVYTLAELESALTDAWYDAILTGYALGWGDGFDALRIIRARQPATPVIMVTAAGSEEIAVQAMRLGFEDYLTPATLERLPLAVRHCTEAARRQQRLPLSGPPPSSSDTEKLVQTLMMLLNTPSDLVLLLELDGRLVFANDTFLRRAGRTRETIAGCRLSDVLPPDLAAQRLAVIQEVARSGQVARFEDHGVVGWFDNTVYPILDDEGKVRRVAVTARDITDKKRIEVALQQSSKTIQALIDAPTDQVVLINRPDRIVVASESFAALLGQKPAEMVGQSIWKYIPKSDAGTHEAKIEQAIRTRQPVRFETHWAARYHDIVIYPILDDHEAVEQLAFISRDVTQAKLIEAALRESENQLQAAVQELETAGVELSRRVDERTAELAQANQDLLRAVRRAEALAQIAARLNTPTELQEIVDEMCAQALSVSSYPAACVFLMADETDEMVPAAACGAYSQNLLQQPPVRLNDFQALFPPGDPSITLLDAQEFSQIRETPFARDSELRTLIDLRLTNAGVFLGALIIFSFRQVKPPTDEELTLLQGLADLGATAIAKARLFHQVVESRSRLETLSRKLVEIQDLERRNLAVELHDQIGQMLTSLRINLEHIGKLVQSKDCDLAPQILRDTDSAEKQVQMVLDQVRQLSLELRPPMLDELGLLPALLTYIDKFGERTGAQIDFRHSGLYKRLDYATEKALYRMVQEGLTNVVRHSGVKEASVRILLDEKRLVAQVRDQGIGFDADIILNERPSTGLSGMGERIALCGGELTIESEPGKGTCLTAEFLLDPAGEKPAETHE